VLQYITRKCVRSSTCNFWTWTVGSCNCCYRTVVYRGRRASTDNTALSLQAVWCTSYNFIIIVIISLRVRVIVITISCTFAAELGRRVRDVAGKERERTPCCSRTAGAGRTERRSRRARYAGPLVGTGRTGNHVARCWRNTFVHKYRGSGSGTCVSAFARTPDRVFAIGPGDIRTAAA